MRGWQLTFYTQQGRSHGTRSIAEWLVAEAKALGISGATMSTAQGGYGRDGRLHWAQLFRAVRAAAGSDHGAQRRSGGTPARPHCGRRPMHFYTKVPVEFGITGEK